ncbi:hypothetical protein CHS0354_019597 [Potamilus streckersoni]|uniref:TRPM-like domain-containing protein n=1 Tax=Potamilus streckersoni TaxID=2493646 RepID=A0AAE0T8W7_9BIVA|nr:hypothetical protein CHS0354_019597 [Potamilus streckersoni]
MNKLRDKMTDEMYQLKLTFDKNLFDISKNISIDTRQQANIRESCMMAAILLNKVEYVEQNLDNGFDLKTFLTNTRLQELYKKKATTSPYKDLISKMRKRIKGELQAMDVNRLLEYLLGDSNLQFKRYAHIDKGDAINIPDDDNQCLDLFIWSVLNNLEDMAKLFWRHGKDAMASALFAHALLSAMSHQIDDKDTKEQCEKQRCEFTSLAIGVLRECYKQDVNLAKDLLIQTQSQWEEASCVLLAVRAKNKQFISEHACQDVFNNIWMGEIEMETGSFCNNLKLLWCIIFPFLILPCIAFKEDDSKQGFNQTASNVQTLEEF